MKPSATFHFSLLTSHFDERKAARGFTLIELLMVIAILGIISTLAVSKIGGIREAAARKVSVTNQIAVERAVGSFLTGGGRLNRLDSLVSTQGDTQTPWQNGHVGFYCTYTNWSQNVSKKELYLGPTTAKGGVEATGLANFRSEYNAGVTPGLQHILCPYSLTTAEADALIGRLGLKFVMAHNEYTCNPASTDAYYQQVCGDGSYVESLGDGRNPNESACVAIAVTNDMTLLAINPIIESGREIYRACGQALLKNKKSESEYQESAAISEVAATGGPLLAFGLSDHCSAVGPANAGLESAPFATYPNRQYYARYIVLIRLRTAGSAIIPEFAGVIDPCGHTVRAAREIIRNL